MVGGEAYEIHHLIQYLLGASVEAAFEILSDSFAHDGRRTRQSYGGFRNESAPSRIIARANVCGLLGENCANEANPLAPSHNERGNGWTPKGTDWRRGSVVNYSPKSALSCWIV